MPPFVVKQQVTFNCSRDGGEVSFYQFCQTSDEMRPKELIFLNEISRSERQQTWQRCFLVLWFLPSEFHSSTFCNCVVCTESNYKIREDYELRIKIGFEFSWCAAKKSQTSSTITGTSAEIRTDFFPSASNFSVDWFSKLFSLNLWGPGSEFRYEGWRISLIRWFSSVCSHATIDIFPPTFLHSHSSSLSML
jgi:hypothetical protein